MKVQRRVLAAALAAVMPSIVLSAASAEAATYSQWINGTRAYSTPGNTYSFLGDVQRTSCIWRTYATVVYEGDHVYVRDDCADGIASTAKVMWSSGGNNYVKYCVNPFGSGTIAHCDLDWPEGGGTAKMFVAGLKTPSTVPGQWQWGNLAAIYD